MCGSAPVLKIEFHPAAADDFVALDKSVQLRIRKVLEALAGTDDPRQRLIPYSGNLKGFWKLRCGDYRLVCELLTRNQDTVLVIHIAHRSRADNAKSQKAINARSGTS